MFVTFSIGFQMYFCTQGEIIDLLAFFKFISSHILIIWNNKKCIFAPRSLSSDSNWSENLLLIHLRSIWRTKNGLKIINTESWVFHGGTQIYLRFWTMLYVVIFFDLYFSLNFCESILFEVLWLWDFMKWVSV